MNLRVLLFSVAALSMFAVVPLSADIVAGDSHVVNFDTASDINDFTAFREATPSSSTLGGAHGATAGTGGSGAYTQTGAGTTGNANDFIAMYAPAGVFTDGRIVLNVGDTLRVAYDLQVSDILTGAGNRLGVASYADVSAASSTFTNFDFAGGRNIVGGVNGTASLADSIAGYFGRGNNAAKFLQHANTVGGISRSLDNDTDTETVASGDWYQQVFELEKLAGGTSFNATSTLNKLNAAGAITGAGVEIQNSTFVNAGLYTDSANGLLAGFVVSASGAPVVTMSDTFDNFSVSVTAAVPEPSSLAVLGMVGLVGLVRRRR